MRIYSGYIGFRTSGTTYRATVRGLLSDYIYAGLPSPIPGQITDTLLTDTPDTATGQIQRLVASFS